MKRLLNSSKFWVGVLAVINTIVSHYLQIPSEIWVSVDALLMTVIVTICAEDVALKSAK